MAGTITSPQQSRVQRLLMLRQPAATEPSIATIEPPTAVLMMGIANAKSEEAAKREADRIASLPPPTVTITIDPETGQEVRTADGVVLGDPQASVEAARQAPLRELEEALRIQDVMANASRSMGRIAPVRREDIIQKLGGGGARPGAGFVGLYEAERASGRGLLGSLAAAGLVKALPKRAENYVRGKIADAQQLREFEKTSEMYKAASPVLEGERQEESSRRQERRLDMEAKRAEAAFVKNATEFERAQRSEIAKTIASTPFAFLPEGTDPYQYAAQAAGLDALPDHLKPLVDARIAISNVERINAEKEQIRKDQDQALQIAAAQQRERHAQTMERLAGAVAAGTLNEREARREERTSKLALDMGEKYMKADAPYRAIDESFAKVQSLAQQQTGAGDYALLLSYVHGIDNTAAREGEVKMAQGATSLATQARQKLQNWKTGELLDPSIRAQIVAAASDMRKAVQPFRKKISSRYSKLAESANVDKSLVGLDDDTPTATHVYVPGKGLVKK